MPGPSKLASINQWHGRCVISCVMRLPLSSHGRSDGKGDVKFAGENNFSLGRLRSTTGEQLLYKRVGIAIRRRAVSNA